MSEVSETAGSVNDVGKVALGGKYLTFVLGDEIYGVEILKVQEIIGIMKVTHVPRMPGFVRGVINLRGKIIPVIELRSKFGLESKEDSEKTCIIVVQIAYKDQTITMGVLVDEVSEVLEIEASSIEPPPSFGATINIDFIMGLGKVGEKVIMLLDVDSVLTSGELSTISQDAK